MGSKAVWRVASVAAAVLLPAVGLTHGTEVTATLTRRVKVDVSVAVQATDHSGRPMAGAQVTVLAPGAPEAPWLAGECDGQGRFEFAPPPDRPGVWIVRVAHQGHGGRVSVELPVDEGAAVPAVVRAEASSAPHLTVLQRTVMGACVVWGLIGTALFFSRRRRG